MVGHHLNSRGLEAALLDGRDVEDAVGIDEETHLDLGQAPGMGGMPRSSNSPSERQSRTNSRSPCRTWTFTLVCPSTCVVNISVARAGMVVFGDDELGHRPAEGFDAPATGGYVQQQQVAMDAGKNRGLHRRAQGHDFIGVQAV